MGMSVHVVGIKPPDEKWRKMKAVWDACKTAGLQPPPEVERFFDGTPPDDSGVLVNLHPRKAPCVSEYHNEYSEGFEVDLRKLPADITILRFFCSY